MYAVWKNVLKKNLQGAIIKIVTCVTKFIYFLIGGPFLLVFVRFS
ncbi:hypothetical protein B4143_1755 [Bacillus subtilis]|nr:hypothetical protein B4143_1755 [Bacillus subtilis]RPK09790.1 hypothetical protein EH5_02627 [Bacillus subtilis]